MSDCGMRIRTTGSGPEDGAGDQSGLTDSAIRNPQSAIPEIAGFTAFLSKERNDSPHTVKAYARDVADFAAFCGRYYGGRWSWAGVDRLAVRGWLGGLQQGGPAKRSAARALSGFRTLLRIPALTRGL